MNSFVDVVKICFVVESRKDDPDYIKCVDIYAIYVLLEKLRSAGKGVVLSLTLSIPSTGIETVVEINMYPERDIVTDIPSTIADNYIDSSDVVLSVPSTGIEVEVQ
ncbi:MAG: hypothetical protein DRO40_11230 [Thermoprotei archaeon]|nr:MAG: hypothetical protein DRO40_11230 [Thermoprotei archaeon]